MIDPCVPADWKEFRVNRTWRGAEYRITVQNPDGVEKGVAGIICSGQTVDGLIPAQPGGSVNEVVVMMGRREYA